MLGVTDLQEAIEDLVALVDEHESIEVPAQELGVDPAEAYLIGAEWQLAHRELVWGDSLPDTWDELDIGCMKLFMHALLLGMILRDRAKEHA